jgi:hypothetical protein
MSGPPIPRSTTHRDHMSLTVPGTFAGTFGTHGPWLRSSRVPRSTALSFGVRKIDPESTNGSTWSNIVGATDPTYAISEANEGHRLRVVATSADNDGGGTSANSAATASVTDPAR